jgi:hypothetical protein
LHWVLDVTFREDDSRVRDPTVALNLDRLAMWFAKRPLAVTRISRFAALLA